MDLFDVQRAIGTEPDGKWGKNTRAAAERAISAAGANPAKWTDARKRVGAFQSVLKAANLPVGVVDGFEGPQTRYAMGIWDAAQVGDLTKEETWRDEVQPTPALVKPTWPLQKDVTKFYGDPGANQTMLVTPYAMKLAWDTKTAIKRFSIHEKCHDSALRVLQRAADHYGPAGIAELGLDLFGGCLNVRTMRGGSNMSMHSWGIAIDFDPDRNQLKWGRNRARLARPDAAKWWDLWAEEGWVSLGRQANYDWMHVQAARL